SRRTPAAPLVRAGNREADPYGGPIRFGSSYVRLRPEAVERSTFCFPDSVFEPVDVGDRSVLTRLCELADVSGPDALDECVEAHVHGPVRFDTDVEALVLDPCFAGTDVEQAATSLGCPVEFHPGFLPSPARFDPQYRGPEVVALARSLAEELTPAVVGAAARSGSFD